MWLTRIAIIFGGLEVTTKRRLRSVFAISIAILYGLTLKFIVDFIATHNRPASRATTRCASLSGDTTTASVPAMTEYEEVSMERQKFKCKMELVFRGGALVLTDENCMLYRHIFDPEVDHLYFEHEDQGYYIFSRRDFYAEWERKCGLTLTRAYAKPGDLDAYANHCVEVADLDDELKHFFQDGGDDGQAT